VKNKRTAEEVCIAYAQAVAEVRRFAGEMKKYPCEVVFDWCESSQETPNPEDCLDEYFRVETYQAGDDRPTERRAIAIDEVCPNCQERLRTINDRKDARKRLGAAKRAVEAVGKRLRKE
jgi:hypothetical protein